MHNPPIRPLAREIVRDEPPIAVMRRVLAAKQTGAVYLVPVDGFYASPGHEIQEPHGVVLSSDMLLLVFVEHLLCRRENGHVLILDAAKRFGEVPQVLALRESAFGGRVRRRDRALVESGRGDST